uniref:Flagellar associated protein n=1 Tax=Tetraselmis sp. GSL018 TaxID=582737 RepID=A0A061QTH0_9CHLO
MFEQTAEQPAMTTEAEPRLGQQGESRPGSALLAAAGIAEEGSSISYDRILGLFTHEHSSGLYERHIAAVHRVCRHAKEGFAIRDLPKVKQVLEFTLALLRRAPSQDIEEATELLLRTLAKPFLRRTSTDEFKLLSSISALLSGVAMAIEGDLPGSVRIAAAEMLAVFASAHGGRPSQLEAADQPAETADTGSAVRQFHTNQGLIQRSGIIPRVAAAMEADMSTFCLKHVACSATRAAVRLNGGPGSPPNSGEEFPHKDAAVAMLRALLEFSRSADNAAEALRSGALSSLPGFLALGMHDPAVPIALELLWNCLESVPKGAPRGSLQEVSVRGIASALSRLLKQFLEDGFSEADKHTRNEVVLLMLLMMEEQGFREVLCEHGVHAKLAALCTVPELAEPGGSVPAFAVSTDPVDFELRQISWSCLLGLCREPGAVDVALEQGLLQALLIYVDVEALGFGGGCQAPVLARWNAEQLRSLQEHALALMVPAAFRAAGADVAVLQLANNESSHRLLGLALQVLRAAATHAPARDALGEGGAMVTALNLLCDVEAPWPESIRCWAAILLGDLCHAHERNQVLFRKADGVVLLQQTLVDLRAKDSTLPSKLVLAVLRAVWNCIAACRKNLVRFLAMDGMDALLDILEVGHNSLHPIGLSILADILENPKAHVFFHEWLSSRSGWRAPQLLLWIWKQEDEKRGITRKGVLTNTARPLAGVGERTAWLPRSEVAYGFQSPVKQRELAEIAAAVDGDFILSRVFVCCKLLGFPSVVEVLGEEEQATLVGIEAYVKFRQGEFWQDLRRDLAAACIEPTEEDASRIASGIEASEFLAETVRGNQRAIMDARLERDLEAEAEFYRSKKLQQAQEQEAKKLKQNKSKLTMAERKRAKEAKERMLENSYSRVWDSRAEG